MHSFKNVSTWQNSASHSTRLVTATAYAIGNGGLVLESFFQPWERERGLVCGRLFSSARSNCQKDSCVAKCWHDRTETICVVFRVSSDTNGQSQSCSLAPSFSKKSAMPSATLCFYWRYSRVKLSILNPWGDRVEAWLNIISLLSIVLGKTVSFFPCANHLGLS